MSRAFLFSTSTPKGKTPMAIILEANYSKKIGLAGYSSHQFSVTLKQEITDASKVQAESDRLYALLQESVDRSIQQVGFLPDHANGSAKPNGHGHGQAVASAPRNRPPDHDWKCSVAQKELILKVADEQQLDQTAIEQLAQQRFRKGVKALNKLEASGFITELLAQPSGKQPGRTR
jgi:hypothetical protein